MKKLITILFGLLLLGLVSCTNSTAQTPANTGGNESGGGETGGSEIITDKIEGFTFSITGKNAYKTETKILKSYDDILKFNFVENSLVTLNKVGSNPNNFSLYLQYIALENHRKIIFSFTDNKITLYDNPNTNAITINSNTDINNSKTISITIDYTKLY
ncbi:MAG: hypothetical protein J6X54_02395 [Treponema sp.]|nr:hypothetical protein [Treponema sp.]